MNLSIGGKKADKERDKPWKDARVAHVDRVDWSAKCACHRGPAFGVGRVSYLKTFSHKSCLLYSMSGLAATLKRNHLVPIQE